MWLKKITSLIALETRDCPRMYGWIADELLIKSYNVDRQMVKCMDGSISVKTDSQS